MLVLNTLNLANGWDHSAFFMFGCQDTLRDLAKKRD